MSYSKLEKKNLDINQVIKQHLFFISLLQVISYITISQFCFITKQKKNGSSRTRKDKKGNDRNDVKTKNISYCWLHWRVSLQFYIDHLSYRLWWPQPSNDTTTAKKKTILVCLFLKKKRKTFPLLFLFIIILSCFVSWVSSIRLHVDGDLFFSFFCRGKPNKRKRTTTKPNGCCCVLRHKLVAFPTDARDVLPLFFLFFQILWPNLIITKKCWLLSAWYFVNWSVITFSI